LKKKNTLRWWKRARSRENLRIGVDKSQQFENTGGMLKKPTK